MADGRHGGRLHVRAPGERQGKRLRVGLFVTDGGTTDDFEPYVFTVR